MWYSNTNNRCNMCCCAGIWHNNKKKEDIYMKKTLVALLLVSTLLMSCFCNVSATTKDEFLVICQSLERDVVVATDIAGKLTVGGTYADLVRGRKDAEATFMAEIDMADVKKVVEKVVKNAETALTDADELAAFMALPVEGSFTFSAEWTGVTPPADIETGALKGFKFDDSATSDVFEEGPTRILERENLVSAVIDIKEDVTVADILNLPAKITLEIGGFSIVSDGEMKGQISGFTKIKNGLTESYDVTYKFIDESNTEDTSKIKPVEIDLRTGSGTGAGGSSTTSFVTITYDMGDGTIHKKDSVVEGKKIELTEVPEKEGYAFAGWYSDAELTNKITSIVADKNITVYAAWTEAGTPGGEIAHPVPGQLNGDEHFAYLQGYPDGTIRPLDNISRAEVATIFFRLLKAEVRQENMTTANEFEDVSEDAWYNTAVSTMAKMGIINGRSESTFAPEENITRAEFAAICARFDEANEKAENIFTDIDGHWATDYILEAVAYNWINGYEDNTFRPDNFITRAETATLVNRVLVRIPEDTSCLLENMKVWPDNTVDAWYYIAIQEATNSHTYGRIDAVNEKWSELAENTDWTVYEQ
ncbi:MAG: hypothetical protein E7412_02740 [Ruminococcaceae bacterium]|nr:hypothetical protein [Oscillospiraceae bacterium]